jgi:protein ImuA
MSRPLVLLLKTTASIPEGAASMSGARMSALAILRGQIERIETAEVVHRHDRVALGHSEVDGALKGGLARAAIHEVFCAGPQGAAATGFVMGFAGCVSARKPLLWVRQDFSDIETGALSMSGLKELGLDPRRVVMVRAADVESALRTSADALACDALGAVVLELWGETRQFDLVASRKLTLAAQGSGVTGLMLRMAAQPLPSTAETRWMLRAAHSPPGSASMPAAPWDAWGAPRFDAELLRNRHGPCGRWIMEWNCDECQFSEPSTYSQPVAAAPAHRPDSAVLWERRAS